MRTSPNGVFEIACHEGLVPAPYKDTVGIWSYGCGHTKFAGEPDPAKMPKGMPADLNAAIRDALDLFKTDLIRYEDEVNQAIHVPLKQHQFDSLVSFHYNTGGINRARLTKLINAGDFENAAKAFMGWLKPPEIKERHEAEQHLFKTGEYTGKAVTVWGVTETGKVIWTPQARYSREEFLGHVGPSEADSAPQTGLQALISHVIRILTAILKGFRK